MHAVNLRSSLAKVAIGESHSSFETFCLLRVGGGEYHFCKKKMFYIYISFCISMPVLANFSNLDAPF